MAMTYTAISDKPVFVSEGDFMINMLASGTIYAGCAVCASGGSSKVKPTQGNACFTAGGGYIGVAAYNATDGNQIGVIPPGNVVRVRASGAIVAGEAITPVSKGFFKVQTVAVSGSKGVALENISDNGYGKVLLL